MNDNTQAYQNMVEKGLLKQAVRNQLSINQYLSAASDMLADANTQGISTHGSYILAYEGIFSVVMATLEHYGARPGDNDGHRVTAIQRVAGDYGLNPEEFSSLSRIHTDRNRAIYKTPLPPINREQANLAIRLLSMMLPAAKNLCMPRTMTPK